MPIYDEIRNELKNAMKSGDAQRKDALRVILGEFQRQPSKDIDDAQAVKILRGLENAEKERMSHTGETGSPFLDVVQAFLPQMMDEAAVRAWIEHNVDLSQHKNRLQAMGPIMKALGGTADGNLVRKVLQELA